MMKIDDMTTQEKSAALAKLSGVYSTCVCGDDKCDKSSQSKYFSRSVDLYDTANMALAWRVLNWATLEPTGNLAHIVKRLAIGGFMSLPPEIAQKVWLDKILELSIEAGMVTE